MTYRVTAEYGDGWWALSVEDGVPAGHVIATQTRRLSDAAKVATEAIAFALELDPADVDPIVEPVGPPAGRTCR